MFDHDDTLRPRLAAMLEALPHAAQIRQRHESWLDALLDADHAGSGLSPERQVQRLAGFGGSEIGVLVTEQRGDYNPFDTAREICQRKLLLSPPAAVDDPYEPGAKQRGTDLEPLIRQYFHALTGARTLTAERVALQAHHHRDHPWMLYTPDDLVRLHGLNLLVDYKAPFQPPAEVALHHGCQLHQGALLAEDAGIGIDRLLLVAWDLQHWKPLLFMVERDPQLDAEIRKAGDHYWRFVLDGECPPWPQRDTPQPLALTELPEAQRRQIEQAALDYVRLDILAKEAKTMAEQARTRLEKLSGCLAEEVSTGPVKLKPTRDWNPQAIEARLPDAARAALEIPKWDAEQLAEMVRQLGADPSPAINGSRLDMDRAAQWLIEQLDIPQALLEETGIKPSISRRKADRAMTDALRDDAAATIQQHRSVMPGP